MNEVKNSRPNHYQRILIESFTDLHRLSITHKSLLLFFRVDDFSMAPKRPKVLLADSVWISLPQAEALKSGRCKAGYPRNRNKRSANEVGSCLLGRRDKAGAVTSN
jgi:hypothetical protein